MAEIIQLGPLTNNFKTLFNSVSDSNDLVFFKFAVDAQATWQRNAASEGVLSYQAGLVRRQMNALRPEQNGHNPCPI